MNFLLSDIAEICKDIQELVQEFSGKNILLTGGNGFLGRYFAEVFDYINQNEMIKQPCKVIILDNFIVGEKSFDSHPTFMSVQHDINQGFQNLNLGKIDFVICCAGIASPFYYRKYPLQTIEIITKGLQNCLDLAKENKAKLLYFSSSEIYGDPDPAYIPTDENYPGRVSCLGSRACYDESKRLGETLVETYCNQFDLQAVIVRPFNVYGPGMQKNDFRVLPNFAAKIIKDEPIDIFGSGNQTRTFCYITDAIKGFLRALLLGKVGEPYNIGNPNPEISMIELSNIIEKVLDHPIKKNIADYPVGYPANEPSRRCPDIQKAASQLQYAPNVSIEKGVKRFFSWAKDSYND